MIVIIFILSVCGVLFFSYYGIKYDSQAFIIAAALFIFAALIAAVSADNADKNEQLKRENATLAQQRDSLQKLIKPCPDTHYIFMPPPMR